MVLLDVVTESLINKGAFLAALILSGLGLLKAVSEYVKGEVDKVKLREDANVEKEKLHVELERAKIDKEVVIAKENSAGASAILSLREADKLFVKRIEEIEQEIDQGFKGTNEEVRQLRESLEGLKREHTEFISKSLEYYMSRKS